MNVGNWPKGVRLLAPQVADRGVGRERACRHRTVFQRLMRPTIMFPKGRPSAGPDEPRGRGCSAAGAIGEAGQAPGGCDSIRGNRSAMDVSLVLVGVLIAIWSGGPEV